jgi:hypothetical protein
MKNQRQTADAPPEWAVDADKVANALDADVILLSGGLYPPADFQLMALIGGRRRKNVVLILTTFGGSGEVAYRIAHHLQRAYSNGEFILFVPMMCKSAGTLIAVGSHQIIMADTAELGPLDVQILKVDEVGERHSGLTPSQTLNTLKNEAFNLFDHCFGKLRERFRFPTKMAATIAARMSVGLLAPIYGQIAPMRLGEIERAVLVAGEYGERIKTENLRPEALSRLLTSYPAHGFVIDREEANKLFIDVRQPTVDELQLFIKVAPVIHDGQARYERGESAHVLLLSTPLPAPADKAKGESSHDDAATASPTATDSGGEGVEVAGKAEPKHDGELASSAKCGNGEAG